MVHTPSMYDTLRGLAVTENNQAPVRILLADDHRIFRQGLRELIERKTPFAIVGEAATGSEVLHLAATLQPILCC